MRDRVIRRPGRLFFGATVLVLGSALALQPAKAASKIDGLWDAVIMTGGGPNATPVPIPFRFEIATDGANASKVQGFFFEGDRKIGSTAGTFADGVLKLEYEFLNTT